MPIYEFYCGKCHMIFNFYSKRINTTTIPLCPKCKNNPLSRQMSLFSVTGTVSESEMDDSLPMDEKKMEKAMRMLAGEAEKINEDDPRQAADLMRKLSDMTGLQMGEGMHEALNRLEQGESPDKIEAEMGDLFSDSDPFIAPGAKLKAFNKTSKPPRTDETLYDL